MPCDPESRQRIASPPVSVPTSPSRYQTPADTSHHPVVDINKVSTATQDLLRLLSRGDICDTPSTISSSLPTSVRPSPLGMMSAGDITTMSGDSPTPLRNRRSSNRLKPGRQVSLSSLHISPLRLGLHPNSLLLRPSGEKTRKTDNNPFVITPLKSARQRGDEETVDMRSRSGTNPFVTYKHLTRSETSRQEASENLEVSSSSEDEADSPREPLTRLPKLALDIGPSIDRVSLLSVLPGSTSPEEEHPRSSFDFTGEFNMLSEEGNRQSFVEQMAKFGLINPADNSTSSDTTVTEPSHQRQQSSGSSIFTKPSPFRGRLNPGFQFGSSRSTLLMSPPVHGNLGKPPPPTAFNKPVVGYGPAAARHQPNPSVFSFGSISSVGDIVSTGIAGSKFKSVYEPELPRSIKQSLGLPLPPNRPQVNGVPGSSPRRVLWKTSSIVRARQISINSALSLRLNESPLGQSKLGHTRQNSSIDSNRSSAQRLGRPGCDAERMFTTEGTLASITQSPQRVASYDSSIEIANLTGDSFMDSSVSNLGDSIFGGTKSSPGQQFFKIRSARPISGISCVSSDSSTGEAALGGSVNTWARERVEHGSPLADRRLQEPSELGQELGEAAINDHDMHFEAMGADDSIMGTSNLIIDLVKLKSPHEHPPCSDLTCPLSTSPCITLKQQHPVWRPTAPVSDLPPRSDRAQVWCIHITSSWPWRLVNHQRRSGSAPFWFRACCCSRLVLAGTFSRYASNPGTILRP